MENQTYRIAIVEDNATARINLRSHLLALDIFDISSYSNGKELRNGLRTKKFDILLMDYHLGQHKTGVEWVQHLKEVDILSPSTGIIFVTSDRLPQTISQILDIHPDAIMIKPYTIKSLVGTINQYLKVRTKLMPALEALDNQQPDRALALISEQLNGVLNNRFVNDFLKIKGQLLISRGHYQDAILLYASILKKSSKVLWAHWGLIKSQFLAGEWQNCEQMLDSLINTQLTKDKAYEWLACVSLGKQEYAQAELLLNNIKESELTLHATKLKVYSYKMQNKTEDSITLLEKKRQSNFTIKERFDEFTIELARCHLQRAEHVDTETEHRKEYLQTAKKLIGKTGRTLFDRQSEQQRDYLLAVANVLEGNNTRAEKIVTNNVSHDFSKASVETMIDAVKVWSGLGNEDKAREVLLQSEHKMNRQQDQIDQLVADQLITETEKSLGLEKEKALRLNDQGMDAYLNKNYNDALQFFNKAHIMYPNVPAFSLNLLQCLCDAKRAEFKNSKTLVLLKHMQNQHLTPTNSERLARISTKIDSNTAMFTIRSNLKSILAPDTDINTD